MHQYRHFIQLKTLDWVKMDNSTTEQACGKSYQIFSIIVYTSLSVLIIGGNAFCLVVLYRAKHFKTPTRIFLTSLTCFDLAIGLFTSFPLAFTSVMADIFPEAFIDTIATMSAIGNVVCSIGSVISLLLVNFDRYLAIEYPLSYTNLMTTKRAQKVIASACFFDVIVLMVTILVTSSVSNNGFIFKYCDTFLYSRQQYLASMTVGIVIFSFLPFAITVVIYGRILVIVNRHKKTEDYVLNNVHISNENQGKHLYRQSDHKALNTFLIVTVISCATWIPFSIFMYCGSLIEGSAHHFIAVSVHGIGLCTSWVNICVYTTRDRSFRKAAFDILKCYTDSSSFIR